MTTYLFQLTVSDQGIQFMPVKPEIADVVTKITDLRAADAVALESKDAKIAELQAIIDNPPSNPLQEQVDALTAVAAQEAQDDADGVAALNGALENSAPNA